MSNQCTSVPSFIPGRVVGKLEAGICQDGARFLFLSSGTSFHLRVKATNKEAEHALEEALRSRDEVVIAGYVCRSAEDCMRFDCYAVWPAVEFTAKASNF